MAIAPEFSYEAFESRALHRQAFSYANAGVRPNAFAYGLLIEFFATIEWSRFYEVMTNFGTAHIGTDHPSMPSIPALFLMGLKAKREWCTEERKKE